MRKLIIVATSLLLSINLFAQAPQTQATAFSITGAAAKMLFRCSSSLVTGGFTAFVESMPILSVIIGSMAGQISLALTENSSTIQEHVKFYCGNNIWKTGAQLDKDAYCPNLLLGISETSPEYPDVSSRIGARTLGGAVPNTMVNLTVIIYQNGYLFINKNLNEMERKEILSKISDAEGSISNDYMFASKLFNMALNNEHSTCGKARLQFVDQLIQYNQK